MEIQTQEMIGNRVLHQTDLKAPQPKHSQPQKPERPKQKTEELKWSDTQQQNGNRKKYKDETQVPKLNQTLQKLSSLSLEKSKNTMEGLKKSITPEAKRRIEEQKRKPKPGNENRNQKREWNGQVFDSGSSLYDSSDLKSFNRQLDSLISASSRSLSMSHLPDRTTLPLSPLVSKKHTNKFSGLKLLKLLISVFKSKQGPGSGLKLDGCSSELYAGHDKLGPLATIYESRESPFLGGSEVRRTRSERFTSKRGIDISC